MKTLLNKYIDILHGDYESVQKSNFDNKLRDYQEAVSQNAITSRKQGLKRGLVLLPTGSGKTVTIFKDAFHVMDAVWTKFDGKGVLLYIVPSDQLRSQAVKDIKNYRHGNNVLETTVDLKKITDEASIGKRPVIVTTYQYFHQNLEAFRKLPINYVAIDEAHHSFAQSYDEIILETLHDLKKQENNILFTMAVTATEIAVKGKRGKELQEKLDLESSTVQLRDLFDNNILIDKTTPESYTEFIEKGYLAPVKNRAALIKVKTNGEQGAEFVRGAEFDYGKIYKQIAHDEINNAIFTAYTEKIPKNRKDKPTKITTLSIEHAYDLKEHFNKQGFSADQIAVLHSDSSNHSLSKDKQRQMIKDFESGKIKVLLTIGMLREGYDFPGLYNLILGAPIYSEYIYKQEIGRVMRMFPGKDYGLVIDLVYNFGRYQSQNMYSVFGRNTLDPEQKKESLENNDTKTEKSESTVTIEEISWLEETDFVNYLKPINPETHVILSIEGTKEFLGYGLAQDFSKNLAKKYPLKEQSFPQTLHHDIEVIKGKSGTRDSLAVKKEDFKKFVIAEGFFYPKAIATKQINPETHVILTTNYMKEFWGIEFTVDFSKHLEKKYPIEEQPISQNLHHDIEVIKGKSGPHNSLAVKKEDFKKFVIAEGFEFPKNLPLQQLNPETHSILTPNRMAELLGHDPAQKFSNHLTKKYPLDSQPPSQIFHNDIEVIKGKSGARGSNKSLAVKKADFKKFVIAEGFVYPEAVATKKINIETHVILSENGMSDLLGQKIAQKFSSHFNKKYPPSEQPLSQTIYNNIEIIKGKSGSRDALGVKKSDFKKLVIAEEFVYPKEVATKLINTETHVILSTNGMVDLLGSGLAEKFNTHLKKKYPNTEQPLSQTIHGNIEIIKGKSGIHDTLGVNKSDFENFLKAESPEFYQKYLERKKKEK